MVIIIISRFKDKEVTLSLHHNPEAHGTVGFFI
jgi:hypothetical protein